MSETDIKTKLSYSIDNGVRPYFYSFKRTESEKAERPDRKEDIPTNISREVEVVVRDARKQNHSLDKNAFQLVEQKTSLTTEEFYRDEEKIKTVYYKEISELIKKSTGAEHVFVFHHQVRNKDKCAGVFNVGIQDYAHGIHCDTSPCSAENLFAYMFLLCPEAEEILTKTGGKGRFIYMNAWRNISETPIWNNHLAVCDETSVVKPDDYIISDFIDRKYIVHQYVLSDRNSDKHRWYYYPSMKKEEVLLFKQWDSDTTQTGRVGFHTAFKDPNAPADSPTRESIEVRAVAYLPNQEPNTCPLIDIEKSKRELEAYKKDAANKVKQVKEEPKEN